MRAGMQNRARVAIGLPVFNAERYLAEALDACLAQTYSNLEIIISDNASTDRTRAICEAYADRDSRIRYFRNETNLGTSPNFNRTFTLSSSEYFKWAPYDDVIAPEYLERCVQVLDTQKDCVLCYSRAVVIDEQSRYVIDYDPGPATQSTQPEVRFRNLMLRPEYAIQQMGLIRSTALRKTSLHGPFPSCDEVLLGELALLGRFHEIAERLYRYRMHGHQSTYMPKQRDRILVFDTSLAHRIVLPKWRYFFACVGAIRRNRLSPAVAFSCCLTMLRWLLVGAHIRAMAVDLLLAGRRKLGRMWTYIGRKLGLAVAHTMPTQET
jgi:glycosyltransferase involved in cell wall biosynthesis